MKCAWLFPLVVMMAFTLSADPATAQQRREYTEVHMGVRVRITVYAPDDSSARAAARAGFARMRALDAMMSDYRPDSELRRLGSRAQGWTPVSAALFDVLARALTIAHDTDGAFDPTVGPLVSLWREARRTGRLPDPETLAAAKQRVGWRLVQLDSAQRAVRFERAGMRLDLGGIAKGYILQAAAETMRAHGFARTLIEAGGDIVAGGAPPGRAGWSIDHAAGDTAFERHITAFANAALATSGPDTQFTEIGGVRYSHVLDPRTGLGLTHGRMVHVIAPHGATADAFATAAGILGCDAPPIQMYLAREAGLAVCVEARTSSQQWR